MKKVLIAILATTLVACNYGHSNAQSNNVQTQKAEAVENNGVTPVKLYVVNKDNEFTEVNNLHFLPTKSTDASIVVDDSKKYQNIEGFGAALTDSSAYLLYNLPSSERHQVLTKLFGKNNANFTMIRLPLGASDFALNNYSYDDNFDPTLQNFSIGHDTKYIIPLLQEIIKINPNIEIVATPWSAPGWMKTNDSYFGVHDGKRGELRQEYMATYAKYLAKSILAYQHYGINIQYLTLQNEPLHDPDNYGGMYMSAEQQHEFLNNYLAPEFTHQNIDTKVLAYDHNWDHPEYPHTVMSGLSQMAEATLAGTAYHCYGGDVNAQSETHKLFPKQKIFMTECSGGDWADNFNDNLIWDMDNLFIGNINNWGNGATKWNLALDQNHGPYVGGCTNCRGLLTINTTNNQVKYNEDFYSTASMSKFIGRGAYRIDAVVTNPELKATAVLNQDQTITLVIANNADSAEAFSVKWDGKTLTHNIAAKTVNIVTWKK